MEKKYMIPADLFHQIKDVICILRLPHIMQHLSKIDRMTAKDIIDIAIKLDQVETRRVLNHILRTAYQNKDLHTIEQIRTAKIELDNEPEGVDAIG